MSTNTNDTPDVLERYAEGITEPARPHDESMGELRKRIEVLEAARTTDLENEGKLRMENAELRGRLRSVPSAGDAALLSVRANQIECLQKEVDRLHEELESMTKDRDELQAKLDAAESENSALRTECTDLRGKLEAMTSDRDEWRRTYKNVPPDAEEEMAQLREELDARTVERDRPARSDRFFYLDEEAPDDEV